MKDSYATITDGEVWLHNLHIPPYKPAAHDNHPPERDRKLLLHKREIDRVVGRIAEKGWTLVPTRIYFSNGRAKVELALARGKDRFDKRRVDQGSRDEARHGSPAPRRRAVRTLVRLVRDDALPRPTTKTRGPAVRYGR